MTKEKKMKAFLKVLYWIVLIILLVAWVVSFRPMIKWKKKNETADSELIRRKRWNWFAVNVVSEFFLIWMISAKVPHDVIFLIIGLLGLALTTVAWQLYGRSVMVFAMVKILSLGVLAMTQFNLGVQVTGWGIKVGLLVAGIILVVINNFWTRSAGVFLILHTLASTLAGFGLGCAGNIANMILAVVAFGFWSNAFKGSKMPGKAFVLAVMLVAIIVAIVNFVAIGRFFF